jgi:Tfp pilus assembly protein PilO
MAGVNISTKKIQIDKANLTIVVVVAVACFLTIFSLVASKVLVGELAYQKKVIDQKNHTRKVLKDNLAARDQLVAQYQAFVSTSTNAIGGSVTGAGDRDGDNAKIVLDALPSKYDFPALATSLEKLMSQNALSITAITGSDDEVAQSSSDSSSTPQPVEMPFQITFDGSTQQTSAFFDTLQKSIRPIKVQSVLITGSDTTVSTDISAVTYYQPQKSLNIRNEVVKR